MQALHRFIGNRVIKTGVSVFVTAVICVWLNWPPVFAVITAIVTIEPTISDSIKKGIVRFPASAIGSAYAVIFIALFGNSPITYTLAAVFTIWTCYKLQLHAGLLVATLTAVAMVEVINSNYLIHFFIRLGTTTTGLLVSTIVNILIYPPDYSDDIAGNIRHIGKRTGSILEETVGNILYNKPEDRKADQTSIRKLHKKIKRTEELIRFQNDEAQLHPLIKSNKGTYRTAKKRMAFLHTLHYHLDNLIYMPINKISWSSSERDIIMESVSELANVLQRPTHYHTDMHQRQLKQITDLFWEGSEEVTEGDGTNPTKFPPEFVILYELVSIFNLVDGFYKPDNTAVSHKTNNGTSGLS